MYSFYLFITLLKTIFEKKSKIINIILIIYNDDINIKFILIY